MWKTEREIKHSKRDLGIVNQQVEIWHLQLICSSADSTLKTQRFYFPSGLNYNLKSNIMCWCIFWGIFKGYMCWSMLWREQNPVACTPIVTGKALTQKTFQVESSVGVCTERNDKFEVLLCLLSNLSAVLNDFLTSICHQNPGRDTYLSCFSPTALAWSVLASAVSRYANITSLLCSYVL